LTDTGKHFGITRERARQIIDKAFRKLGIVDAVLRALDVDERTRIIKEAQTHQ
jgi:DNA-directed RNA polymerase sigma subunit (sigma70/sigma32)